jgi:YesN/AraC family two-component response regulator
MLIHEQVQYEHPLLFLKIWQTKRLHNNIGQWHYHKEHEFICVLDGELEIHLENEVRRLKSGDVVLIGSSQVHRDRFFRSIDTTYICMQTDLTKFFDVGVIPYLFALSESQGPLSRLNYIFDKSPEARTEMCRILQAIYEESSQKQTGYELAVSMYVKKMMLLLVRNDSEGYLNLEDNDQFIRLQPVLEYVEAHLNDRLLVDKCSQLVNMSYYYFVKYFKNVIGVSFTDYLQQKRIRKAEQLLLTTESSIVDIGEQIGMQNMSHFYKLFKRLNGHSPNDFRKKRRG